MMGFRSAMHLGIYHGLAIAIWEYNLLWLTDCVWSIGAFPFLFVWPWLFLSSSFRTICVLAMFARPLPSVQWKYQSWSAGIYCEFQTWCGWHDPSQLCDTGSWSSYLASPILMCRIEGSGGVTINCWQLIIIHKYINRGHRTLKLQEPYCLDIGVATCGRPGCPGWQSHPCDLCREGWNMAPRLHWHWEPVQKQWRFNWFAVNKSAECASWSSRNCSEHCTLLFLLLPPPHQLLPLCTTLMTGQTLMPVSLWIFAKSI